VHIAAAPLGSQDFVLLDTRLAADKVTAALTRFSVVVPVVAAAHA
jgi:hypothetical protein